MWEISTSRHRKEKKGETPKTKRKWFGLGGFLAVFFFGANLKETQRIAKQKKIHIMRNIRNIDITKESAFCRWRFPKRQSRRVGIVRLLE